MVGEPAATVQPVRIASDADSAWLIAPPIDIAARASGVRSGCRCPGTPQMTPTTSAWVGMSASAALYAPGGASTAATSAAAASSAPSIAHAFVPVPTIR